MDPVSAAASVIACYQLASEVGCQYLRYVRGVRQAHKDGDFVVAQIRVFQLSLHHLQGMLANEAGNRNGGSRLKVLHEVMNGNSASLVLCSQELEKIRTKLEKAQSGGTLREVFHKLAWPLKQEEVDRAMSALNSFSAAIDRGLAIDNNEVVRGIDSTTKDINSTTKQILVSTESAEAQQEQWEKLRRAEEERQKAEKVREQILDWLAHPDPSEIHNIACRARKSTKTGRWLLNGAAFREFRETPRSILWLHGDSGCGKSVLCSAIIDELRALRLEEPSVRLAYWYFSVNDANRRSFQNLTRALLTQLCPTREAAPALVNLWNTNRKGREVAQISDSIQTLVQMLVEISMFEDRPKFFIFIDALDESNEAERVEIVDMLRRIILPDIDVHLLVTSRSNTTGVEQGLQDVIKLFNVVIERQHADGDILTHITERLQVDEDLNKWPLHLRKDIEQALITDAAGMFRWVDCQLQAICRCRKPKELRKALTSLPKSLRELYAREVRNIEDRAVEDVRKLLGWLTYPQRPLRVEEAAEMLAVDLDSDPPCFDEGDRMPRPEDIIKICGSLVRVDKNTEGTNSLGEPAEVQTLTAAHASVIDFLKEGRVQIGREQEVFYTRAAVNLEMAETCLAYLLNFVEEKVVLDDNNIMSYPLARYSAELWDDFYREVVASSGESEVDMTRVNTLVMRLFASRETMLRWIQLCDPDHDTYRVQFDMPISVVKSDMYYAALLGLPGIVSRLIEDGHSIDAIVCGDCRTPLNAACVYGRENTASILLDNGADPNLPAHEYMGCPLAAAIDQNHLGIVKLLLKTRGVNVNARRFPTKQITMAQSKLGEITTDGLEAPTELEEAMDSTAILDHFGPNNGHSTGPVLGAEDLYLSHSMNDRIAESLLYIAAESDSLEIANALLDAGADPNITGGAEWTALQVACCRGSVEIVSILLKFGANPRICDGKSGSPLQAACTYPSLQIVKILVEVPVDVNYVGKWEAPALYLASTARDLEMVGFLLEHGARTDLYGGFHDNPLLVASGHGDIAMVQMLLNAGSDVNRKGGELGTALNAACWGGNIDVVRALIKHDADPNIQGLWKYDNALQTACRRKNANIALLLLEHEADPDLHGGWYGSALHAAFSEGNEMIIRALLAKNADPRYKGGNYYSILQAAVVSKNETAVKIALECGSSPNEKGGWFTYPLLRATGTKTCPDSIVKLLLEAGADPNLEREGDDFTEKTFRTALQHAKTISKAKLLLDSGAEVNTVSGLLGTALHAAIYSNGDQENSLIKFLVDRGADVNQKAENIGSPLRYACMDPHSTSARLLVEAGADLSAIDIGGRSALHMAICRPEAAIELFDYLVDLGSDPLRLDQRGCNGLHYAARANNLAALTKILDGGPKINATDEQGWTPLHWAAASTRRSTKVIKMLLDEGADMNIEDKAGRRALDLATEFNNTESMAILNGTRNLCIDPSRDVATKDFYCDGCSISPDFCGSEDWYKCRDCHLTFDLCSRCIQDKDVLHANGHSWSVQPSTEVES